MGFDLVHFGLHMCSVKFYMFAYTHLLGLHLVREAHNACIHGSMHMVVVTQSYLPYKVSALILHTSMVPGTGMPGRPFYTARLPGL